MNKWRNSAVVLVGVLCMLNISSVANASTITSTLSLGSRGLQVYALQDTLKSLGYFKYASTGYYGGLTRLSVIVFQKANRLTPVGFVGPKTRFLLNNEMQSVIEIRSSSTTNTLQANSDIVGTSSLSKTTNTSDSQISVFLTVDKTNGSKSIIGSVSSVTPGNTTRYIDSDVSHGANTSTGSVVSVASSPISTSSGAVQLQTSYHILAGSDVSVGVSEGIAKLHSGGVIYLPPGQSVVKTPIVLTGSGVTLQSDPSGSTLISDPAQSLQIDSMDGKSGWSSDSSVVQFWNPTALAAGVPNVIEGKANLQIVIPAGASAPTYVDKTFPSPINLSQFRKVGIFFTSNMPGVWNLNKDYVTFTLKDSGGHSISIRAVPNNLTGVWSYAELDLSSAPVSFNKASVSTFELSDLQSDATSQTWYYLDNLIAFNPLGDAIQVKDCSNCALKNFSVSQQLTGSSVAIDANSGTNVNLQINGVSVGNSYYGINIGATSPSATILNSKISNTFMGITDNSVGSSEQFSTFSGNSIQNTVYGMWIGRTAAYSSTSNDIFTEDAAPLTIFGDHNTIHGVTLGSYDMFGIYVHGGDYNTVTGNTIASQTGQTCIQLDLSASYNSISDNTLNMCGGTGIDLNGNDIYASTNLNSISSVPSDPQAEGSGHNQILNNHINYPGSDYWGGEWLYGVPSSDVIISEGKGITLNQASDNTVIGNTIQNASRYPGGLYNQCIQPDLGKQTCQGIFINNGASRNSISNNVIQSPVDDGIIIFDSAPSDGNTVFSKNNSFTNNTITGSLLWGIRDMSASPSHVCSNNVGSNNAAGNSSTGDCF